jgi:hypothetical protein
VEAKAKHPILGRIRAALRRKPRAAPLSQGTKAWDIGARGERRVAKVLDRCTGVRVLHDVGVPGSSVHCGCGDRARASSMCPLNYTNVIYWTRAPIQGGAGRRQTIGMTGLTELIGIICLFGIAPICAWKMWTRLEDVETIVQSTPVVEHEPVPAFYDYEQLAS